MGAEAYHAAQPPERHSRWKVDVAKFGAMLGLLKLLQSIFKALHSEGTPGQVAMGIVLGAGIGLTPLLNVSFPGGMLGLALFTPVGFLLDPLFDRVGRHLLQSHRLRPLWTAWYNTPLLPYTNFNNSVTLGSVVTWMAAAVPLYFLARRGVAHYRATYGARVLESKFMKGLKASRAYTVYRWFEPQ
jgi:hypothetical protein